MSRQSKGPLHSLVARGLIRAGTSKVQVRFNRRNVLKDEELGEITVEGKIIFRGIVMPTINEFCRAAIGHKVPNLHKRVYIDGESLEVWRHRYAIASSLQPFPAPVSAPADFKSFHMFLAELIQQRFAPQLDGKYVYSQERSVLIVIFVGSVHDDLQMWVPDDTVAYLLRNTAPHKVNDARMHSSFPSGCSRCVTYQISNRVQILQLFEGTGIDFVLMKFFATSQNDPSQLEALDDPLSFSSASVDMPRSTHYLHWLACESPAKPTVYHALKMLWWPSLMASSRWGVLQVQFNYVHVKDGVCLQGPLPIAPIALHSDEYASHAQWQVRSQPSDDTPKIRLRFTDGEWHSIPEQQQPSKKTRLVQIA